MMERGAHAGQVSQHYPRGIPKKYAEKLLIAGADPNLRVQVNMDFPHFKVHGEYYPRHIRMNADGFNFLLVT